MKSYRYTVVDVFTTEALEGNALAVFPDASEFDETTMQKIARELNLADTAFVLPATREDCVARVRIFTPAKELAFAGHPTIGGAFVSLQEGIVPKDSNAFVVEEQIGPIPIRIDGGRRPMIWLRTPPVREGMPEDSESLCLVGKADESRLARITVSAMIQVSWSGFCSHLRSHRGRITV